VTTAPNFFWGPRVESEKTLFRLWAPDRDKVFLELGGETPVPMTPSADGWHHLSLSVLADSNYRFRIGDIAVPDPASRAQRGEASVVTDPGRYHWRDSSWKGRPWEETVIYEAHAGLLGGFKGVARHLSRLSAIGVTAIELMPIADFPGARNWGYDGVLPFAPDESYGSPDDLKFLVDEAHALGMMVFLDVVYNHFGPSGNFLPLYAQPFFRTDRHTPWGNAIDFRQPPVRQFFVENALYWISEFHIDGLRFDAVHAICDRDFLRSLAQTIRLHVPEGRQVHLVVENEDNDAQLLETGFTAQWNDDLHHAIHVLLTGEHSGYYADYSAAPAEYLARALREGFVYQGQVSRNTGRSRGMSSGHLPPTAFVAFLQNHDHVGNRALGERLTVLTQPAALRAAIALVLLSPQIPLIFMGEDAGAREPFLYFCDHTDAKLAEAVRIGRQTEFVKFPQYADSASRAQIPDPNDWATYEDSRPTLDSPNAEGARSLYAALLAIRHRHIVPRLAHTCSRAAQAIGEKAVIASWRMGDGATLTLAANFGEQIVHARLPTGKPLWGCTTSGAIAGFSTLCWLEMP
jgi:maltooligosyltrehalose trehalohydrolase